MRDLHRLKRWENSMLVVYRTPETRAAIGAYEAARRNYVIHRRPSPLLWLGHAGTLALFAIAFVLSSHDGFPVPTAAFIGLVVALPGIAVGVALYRVHRVRASMLLAEQRAAATALRKHGVIPPWDSPC